MKKPQAFPEIYIDLNAEWIERGYALTRGSVEDLAKLGLSPADAVGMRFTFVSGDEDEYGNPDDIMFDGIVIHDPKWGYLAFDDERREYRRSQIETSGP